MSDLKRRSLPLNKFLFDEIRTQNMVYVDKTELIYKMISDPQYYFLSRPRRFGKSLLVSTLKHLYNGDRHLFKGLWIDNAEWDWKKWPIIKLDFSSISIENDEALKQGFLDILDFNAKKYGITLKYHGLKEKFRGLLTELKELEKSKVVMLVDEYDKPIIDHLGMGEKHLEIANNNRNVMGEFYGVLKDADAASCIELFFMTGVSKFSKVSIFSKLNTLVDISMSDEFSTLLGYTEEELDLYFSDHIKAWSEEKNISYKEIRDMLRVRYNGFRFAEVDKKVYNPISILSALKARDYTKNYWFDTATPKLLVNLLIERNFDIPLIETKTIHESAFSSFDPSSIDIMSLMLQTGYLTIKDVNTSSGKKFYRLDYTNLEIRTSFLDMLINAFAKTSHCMTPDFYNDLENNHFEMSIRSMQKIFDMIPILDTHDEKFFHDFFYMMARSLGRVNRMLDNEDKMLVYCETVKSLIVLNFSCKFSLEELIMQIRQHNDLKSIKKDNAYLFAIMFDLQNRKISDWKYLPFDQPETFAISKEKEALAKKTRIFLASSNELDEERREIELWTGLKNRKLIENGKFLELIKWEDLRHSFSKERIQDHFNEEMLKCDVVIILFYTKVGDFTKEEFELAYKNMKDGKKPQRLLVFFKTTPIPPEQITEDYMKIIELKKLIKQEQQIYIPFESSDKLVMKLDNQLEYFVT